MKGKELKTAWGPRTCLCGTVYAWNRRLSVLFTV